MMERWMRGMKCSIVILAPGLLVASTSPSLAHEHQQGAMEHAQNEGMQQDQKQKGAKAGKKAVKAQVIELSVTPEGFVPAQIKVKAGKPVTLMVTRRTERTCATDIVVKDYGIKVALPLNKAVDVTFTPKKTGEVRYACAMDMIAGVLIVE